jgi:hypothetical protein
MAASKKMPDVASGSRLAVVMPRDCAWRGLPSTLGIWPDSLRIEQILAAAPGDFVHRWLGGLASIVFGVRTYRRVSLLPHLPDHPVDLGSEEQGLLRALG